MSIFYFTHIPKTAGSSFANIYLEPNFLEGYVRPTGLKDYLRMKIPENACIHGHFPYGMHYLKLWRSFKYIAFLRSPVERVISHYYFILQNPNHPFHELHKNLNIAEIANQSYKYNYSALQLNQQTRFLAGFVDGFWNRKSDKKLVEIAKINIKNRYSFIGFQEVYEESCKKMERLFNWQPEAGKNMKYQVTSIKKEIDQNTKIAIENANLLDLELYEFAKKVVFC